MLHLCSETEKSQNHGKPSKSGFFVKLGQKVITRRAPRKPTNEPEFIKRVKKEEYGKEIRFYLNSVQKGSPRRADSLRLCRETHGLSFRSVPKSRWKSEEK